MYVVIGASPHGFDFKNPVIREALAMAIDKPNDLTDVTASAAGKTSSNLLDLMDGVKKNALAPVVNGSSEFINTNLSLVNGTSEAGTWLVNKVAGTNYQAPEVGKVGEMEVGRAEQGSVAYYAQQVFGTIGSVLPYAVAGKIAGKGLRTVGELAPVELRVAEVNIGSSIRATAQDARVATVLGATAYSGLKDTKEGESHLSNAVSTFVGFSAFEAGNSLLVNPKAAGLSRLGQRFIVGTVGGIAQVNAASIIQENKFADTSALGASAMSGGVLNALMPSGRHVVDAAVENPLVKGLPHSSEAVARLHENAVRALPKGELPAPGSWSDPAAIKSLNRASAADLNTKLKANEAGPTRIDQDKNIIYHGAGDDPLSVIQELAHRRIYRDPKFEEAFQAHAKELKSTDPLDPRNAPAKEGYVDTRLKQEIAARTAQNEEAELLGNAKRVSVDATEIKVKEGYGARFASEADDFVKTSGKKRPGIDHSAGEDVTDWPDVSDVEKHSGVGWDDKSLGYPDGREMAWYRWPEGARVNGYDNVIFAGHYDAARTEALIVTHDPATKARSAIRVFNDGTALMHEDGRGGSIEASAVEKKFDNSVVKVPEHLLFNWDKGLQATKYQVVGGNDLIPDDTTYTRYEKRSNYSLDGTTIYPSGSVEYHDETGRIDWHQDKPFKTLITENASTIDKDDFRYRISVPQTVEGSHRFFTLNEDDTRLGITDEFSKDHPLITDFGKAVRVDREGPKTTFYMDDGRTFMVGHHKGEMLFSEVINGELEDTNILDKYTETYSTPWETVFGQANKVEVTAKSTVFHLVNNGTAEHFLVPRSTEGFDNVEWVYNGPEGEKSIKLRDSEVPVRLVGTRKDVFGQETSVTDTGIAGVDAVGSSEFNGPGGFTRYYLPNGLAMDVQPQNFKIGVVRRPGEVVFIGEKEDDWNQVAYLLEPGKPVVIESTDSLTGTNDDVRPLSDYVDSRGNQIPALVEKYPGTLMTKWGSAIQRLTYADGSSKLKVIDPKTGKQVDVVLDYHGNRVTVDRRGNQIVTPEPANYPTLNYEL